MTGGLSVCCTMVHVSRVLTEPYYPPFYIGAVLISAVEWVVCPAYRNHYLLLGELVF